MQKALKWSPAQPHKKSDNIISSTARETGDLIGFIPSYLKEPIEDMRFIMSNEYMRKWFKEREIYEKNTYSKIEIIKGESKIKRRYVQRMMTYKKPDKFHLLEDKFKRTGQYNDTVNQPTDYTKLKYKPVCSKEKKKGVANTSVGTRNTKNVKLPITEQQTIEDKLPVTLITTNQFCAPCCPGK
ncbi:hypothetical protein ABEB36_002730 [Hypothenemus hampei]|uniref:Uncharacterized protein n=1 Tax=Hypothenemus hampei TaxID=57062 RepID=A0ABD1F6T9_HYPHA